MVLAQLLAERWQILPTVNFELCSKFKINETEAGNVPMVCGLEG